MRALILTLLIASTAIPRVAVPAQVNCPSKPKPNYKVTKLSIQDVGVSCLNGQKPDVKVVGKFVIISCDAE
jgi:hypothetical protein